MKILKKLDHAMIFILIAGSYTPICTIVLGGKVGYGLLTAIWIIAILGIVFKMFWVTCPKWVSSACTSPWAGFALSPLPRYLRNCLPYASGCFWPAVSSIP